MSSLAPLAIVCRGDRSQGGMILRTQLSGACYKAHRLAREEAALISSYIAPRQTNRIPIVRPILVGQ